MNPLETHLLLVGFTCIYRGATYNRWYYETEDLKLAVDFNLDDMYDSAYDITCIPKGVRSLIYNLNSIKEVIDIITKTIGDYDG